MANIDDKEIGDDDVKALLIDLIKHNDGEIVRRLGRPLYATLLVWPSKAHELVNYVGNYEPAERHELAQAMIELLIRWGYIAG
jgi:hypothetical protein